MPDALTAEKGENVQVKREQQIIGVQPTSEKRTYSVPEIAEILQISTSKAYALCKQNLFKSVRIGKYIRISKSSFDQWLDDTH